MPRRRRGAAPARAPQTRRTKRPNVRVKAYGKAHVKACVLETLLAITTERGHAVKWGQLFDAVRVRYPDVSIPSSHQALRQAVARGEIIRVVDRPWLTQYAHPDAPVPPQPRPETVPGVYAAVVAAVARHGRPASTHEVDRVAREQGVVLKKVFTLPNALRSLAAGYVLTPDGRPDHAKIRQISRTDLSGRHVNFWVPTDWAGPTPPAEALLSTDGRPEIVRRAIAEAERELGCPVTRRDIVRWRYIHQWESDVAAQLAPRSLAAVLADITRNGGEARRVSYVTTPFTARGAAPPRYSLQRLDAISPAAMSACMIIDVCARFRVAAEVDSIAALQRGHMGGQRGAVRTGDSVEITDDNIVAQIARVRRCVLQHVLGAYCGVDVHEGCDVALHAATVQRSWVDAVRAMKRLNVTPPPGEGAGLPMDLASIRTRERDIAALRDLLSAPPEACPVDVQAVQVLNYGNAVALTHLDPVLQSAVKLLKLSEHGRSNIVLKVRRIGAPEGSGRVGQWPSAGGPVRPNRLDRPEAILAVFDAVGRPRASALLTPAALLLGYVIRDAELVRRWIALSAPGGVLRRSLVLALGLLGEHVDVASIFDTADPRDMAAACLAAVIADPHGAEDRLLGIDRLARGVAQEITSNACTRAATGRLSTVVG